MSEEQLRFIRDHKRLFVALDRCGWQRFPCACNCTCATCSNPGLLVYINKSQGYILDILFAARFPFRLAGWRVNNRSYRREESVLQMIDRVHCGELP